MRAGAGTEEGAIFAHVSPLPRHANLDVDTVEFAAKIMRVATEFVLAHGGTNPVGVLPSCAEVWDRYIKPQGLIVDRTRMLGGRLWPQTRFETDQGRETVIGLTKAVLERSINPRSTYPISPLIHPFWSPELTRAMIPTPQQIQLGAYLCRTMALGWMFPGMIDMSSGLQALVGAAEMNETAKGVIGDQSGAFLHEADFFDPGWTKSVFGSKYLRLLDVKGKYHPGTLLRCWKCVGSEVSDVASRVFDCETKSQGELSAIVGN